LAVEPDDEILVVIRCEEKRAIANLPRMLDRFRDLE